MTSKKHKNVFRTLNYIDLILSSTINGCVSISLFTSLVGIPTESTSSAIGLKLCAITASIKNYKSIIKKKKMKYDKIVFLPKSTLNRTEVLIFKALIDSVFNHDEFFLINNVLKEYNKIKEEIKNSNDK